MMSPSKTTTKLEQISTVISQTALGLSGLFLILMVVHITIDVVLRFFFNIALHGTLEVVSFYYMVCVVFLPLAFVELKNEHINVDVLVNHFSPHIRLALYLMSCILGIIYFSMLGYQGLLDAIKATQSQETAMANFTFYLWPSRWALPIGFLAMDLAILANAIKAIRLKSAL